MAPKYKQVTGVLASLALAPRAEQPNWTAPYKRCLNDAGLTKTGHITVGVRYDISDRIFVASLRVLPCTRVT
jgi:hypothetical protein